MAKTYTAAGTVVAGDVATAAAFNVVTADINNLIVPPAVSCLRSTTQSIANGTDVFVTWPIEVYDTDGMFTAGSDTVTIQTAGIYMITCNVLYAANATGYRVVTILKNGASAGDVNAAISAGWISATTIPTVVNAAVTTSFAASDTIKVVLNHTAGTALDIGSTTVPATRLSVTWIGRTS